MIRFVLAACIVTSAGFAPAEEPLKIPAPDKGVGSVAYTPDGTGLAVVSVGGSVTMFDVRTGKPRHTFTMGKERCDALAPTFLDDGVTLAIVMRPAGQRTGELLTYDVTTGRRTNRWVMDEAAGSLALSPDGTALAAACGKGVRVYDLATGKERQRIPLEIGVHVFGGVRWTPDGKRLLYSVIGATYPGELQVCDVGTKAVKHRFPIAAVSYGNRDYAVTPDGSEVLTFDPPDPMTGLSKLAVWDLATGKKLRTLGECGYGSELDITPDGKRFVACDHPGRKLVMGEMATGKVVETWDRWTGHGIVVSPDGNSFASAGSSVVNKRVFTGILRARIDHRKE